MQFKKIEPNNLEVRISWEVGEVRPMYDGHKVYTVYVRFWKPPSDFGRVETFWVPQSMKMFVYKGESITIDFATDLESVATYPAWVLQTVVQAAQIITHGPAA